ncbi:MAG TPA: hypothetical protein VKU80_07705 [Planctomycetota bacterium]|nr:hypothetical protein [Planctomycetota bacterium]
MRLSLSVLLAMALAGCHVASSAEAVHWTVKAPSQVDDAAHSKLRFVVETTTPSGAVVEGVAYVWIVDWVGVHGVEHQGVSYREEAIRVKGGPGTAWLRILAVDRYDRLVEVARASFEVTLVQP